MKLKRAKVVLLPTNNEVATFARIYSDDNSRLFWKPSFYRPEEGLEMYVVVDEPIKKGDSYIMWNPSQTIEQGKVVVDSWGGLPKAPHAKIIATTDLSITKYATADTTMKYNMPRLSQSFQLAYATSQGKIKEIDVQYDIDVFSDPVLHVNSKDTTISVFKVKNPSVVAVLDVLFGNDQHNAICTILNKMKGLEDESKVLDYTFSNWGTGMVRYNITFASTYGVYMFGRNQANSFNYVNEIF